MEQRRAEARWGESAEAAQEAERGHLRDLWLGRARRAPFDGLRGIILAADECQARGRGWEKGEERNGGVKSHRGAEYLALAGDSFLPPHHWRTRGSGGGGSDHRPRRRTKAEDGQTSGTRCPARGARRRAQKCESNETGQRMARAPRSPEEQDERTAFAGNVPEAARSRKGSPAPVGRTERGV